MQSLITQIEKEFNLQQTSIIDRASPIAKYFLLIAFWSVLWANSLFDCIVLLFLLLTLAVFGRTANKVSIFLVVTIMVIIAGEIILTLLIKKTLTSHNVIFALQVLILFSSPVIILGNTRVMQHYYFWSNLLGGNFGAAIIGFGRTIFSLRKLITDTADAYRNKGISPIKNQVAFLISLEGSIFHFAKTYADAIEIKNVYGIHGEGLLDDGVTSLDVLMIIVSVLIVLVIFSS